MSKTQTQQEYRTYPCGVRSATSSEGLGGDTPLLDNPYTTTRRRLDFDCRVAFKNFYYYNPKTKKSAIFRCNSWNCVYCSVRKKAQLKELITELSITNKCKYFLTLTLRHNISAESSYSEMSRIFDKFKKRFERKTNQKLLYIWVNEAQKTGYCHKHILTPNKMPSHRWLNKNWFSCGGGFINKEIEISGIDGVAKYLSSYFSKNDEVLPKGFRHYSTNMKIIKEKKEKSGYKLYISTENGVRLVEKGDFKVYSNKYYLNKFYKSIAIVEPDVEIKRKEKFLF